MNFSIHSNNLTGIIWNSIISDQRKLVYVKNQDLGDITVVYLDSPFQTSLGVLRPDINFRNKFGEKIVEVKLTARALLRSEDQIRNYATVWGWENLFVIVGTPCLQGFPMLKVHDSLLLKDNKELRHVMLQLLNEVVMKPAGFNTF